MPVSLIPHGFFGLSAVDASLLSLAALTIGFCVGPILAAWVNRQCEVPPARLAGLKISLSTAAIFGFATFVIVALEGQHVPEVLPDHLSRYVRWISHLALLALLVAATATDLREFIIPDQMTFIGIALGIGAATLSGDVQLIHLWVDWNHPLTGVLGPEIPEWIKQHPHWHGFAWSVCGATVGAGITWLARTISSFVIGQEAMGLGDVTLMAMIGSFLGWQPMLLVFFLAPFCGLLVGLSAKLFFNRSFVPYGPYLALATLVVLLFWKWIWTWEPTRVVSIRRLFGDLPGLAILLSVSFVLLTILMRLARWWRGDILVTVEFPDEASAESPSNPTTNDTTELPT